MTRRNGRHNHQDDENPIFNSGRVRLCAIAALLVAIHLPSASAVHAQSATGTTDHDHSLHAVTFNEVELTDAFWLPRLRAQRETLVPHAFEQTERGVQHLQAAADHLAGKAVTHQPHRFVDSDLFGFIALGYLGTGSTAVEPQAAGDGVATPVVVTADFGKWVDYPLSKVKFSVFNSGWVPLSHYERDIALYDEVQPHSLRVDLWFGGGSWTRQPIGGTSDDIQYNLSELHRLATLLNTHGVLPYWSYSYVPPPLQSTPGDWRSTPTDMRRWGDALGEIARQARQGPPELRIGYHEIYNEPDNRDFFHGDLADYLAMYREGVRGIRAADPDAVVGGPALAFKDAWVAPFLDAVVDEDLPLDFFSFHYYPDIPRKSPDIAGVIADMRRELAQRPELATTQMHLNEYNSYRIDYPEGGRQDRYPIASAMLHDFAYFLTQPDLTLVHWAQFQDTGGGNWSGMISRDGHRKALFNAYRIYQTMPVDRREVRIEGPPGIEAMASADSHNAGIVLWNRTSAAQEVRVVLDNLPFERGNLQVFRIDSEHASWGDAPASEVLQPVEEHRVTSARFAWSGAVPRDGVVYVAADDGSGRSELEPNRLAEVIRVLHYYPERGTTSYANFDPDTWTARFGMGREEQAYQLVGVTAEQLPDAVAVRVDIDGVLGKVDSDSLLGLRIDYETGNGYARSLLFHGPRGTNVDPHAADRSAPMPWGTERAADEVVAVADLSQFRFSPAEYAPDGWTGRVQISFILHNAGPGTRAKFRLATEGTGSDSDEVAELPRTLQMDAPYPNASSGRAVIPYALPRQTTVRLAIYDVLGREVAVLKQGMQPAGDHTVTLERDLPAGVYFARLKAGDRTLTRKLLRLE